MRKIYTAFFGFLFFSIFCIPAIAQRKFQMAVPSKKIQSTQPDFSVTGTTADCDTINYPIDENWSAAWYTDNSGAGNVTGNNGYGDRQKGNFFDLSATTNTYLFGGRFFFVVANSAIEANFSKTVGFNVYEDNGGEPGAQLGTTVDVPLSEIQASAGGGAFDVTFPTPIALPASKKVYVMVDVSNFTWDDDTVALYSTANGEVTPGIAWEQWDDGSWYTMDEAWGGLDIALYIFPFVGTSSTQCSTLPVQLLSFNAQRSNKDVTLSWQIAQEFNMKGYDVERADNNGVFKTVASLPALNNAKNQSYTVTDRNAFTKSSTVQYRLKQIDGDGSLKYSRVIPVKAGAVISDITFANPFNGALKLQLNLAASQNVSVQVFDLQGKPVAAELNKMYNASSNTILLGSTATLKPGMYILKVTAGTEQLQYKIIKQ